MNNIVAPIIPQTAFPFFEEDNYLGWFMRLEAYLRGRERAHLVLNSPRPKPPEDEDGNPLPETAAQRNVRINETNLWDHRDDLAFTTVVMACSLNSRTKLLVETSGSKHAFELIEKLKSRYCRSDAISKTVELKKFLDLEFRQDLSGTDFLDNMAKIEGTLHSMGHDLDETTKLNQLISASSKNSKYKDLARTIYSTPGMSFDKASSLFAGYDRTIASSSTSTNSTTNSSSIDDSTVNAVFCSHCKKNVKHSNSHKNRKNVQNSQKSHRYPCVICDDPDHRTHECPLKSEVRKCVRELKKSSSRQPKKRQKVEWGSEEVEPIPGQDDEFSD